MKNPVSLLCCLLVTAVLITARLVYSGAGVREDLKVTVWDAFGYYLYLPATIIYEDCNRLEWTAETDRKYALSGGNGLPATRLDNGNYALKYLGGVAIMQTPFFLVAHLFAARLGYPADGFSAPYQYAIGFGALLYALLALLLLRRVLLRFFKDRVVALTLLILALGTNYVVYAAIDNGLSHGYIFLLYALVLYTTVKWHERPGAGWAAATGYFIGLATISRPTEAIMLFIPLLWNTHTREAAKQKWAAVRSHKSHLIAVVLAGLISILPQLLYWKGATGSFIYDVGSKWQFLNPHWRVLFGPEKGWFLYTPLTVFFIAGLFFIRRYPFRYSAIIFLLLNLWIVIAWDDWRYGGSYSTRALVQSYPVFALPLCAFIARIKGRVREIAFTCIAAFFVLVNLFQTTQYTATVLHFNDMNWKYYRHIYLNPAPSPEVMSLLDTDEFVEDENVFPYWKGLYFGSASVSATTGRPAVLFDSLPVYLPPRMHDHWIKVEAMIKAPDDLWSCRLQIKIEASNQTKERGIRLFNPVGIASQRYAFYVKIPDWGDTLKLSLSIPTTDKFHGKIDGIHVTQFSRP